MVKSGGVVTAVAAVIGFSTLWMVSAQPQSLTYNLGPVTLGLTPAVLYVFGMLTAALLGFGIWQLQRGVAMQRRARPVENDPKAVGRPSVAAAPTGSVPPASPAGGAGTTPPRKSAGPSSAGPSSAGAGGAAGGKPAGDAAPKGGSAGAGS
ncbi:hypothetical protein SAMN05421595_0151 [Austwickia chelonae]|uniref:Lipopolysaccharide assembly protein A domain-containing protein n=1 Tax=Austwickia chelonae NBRC 105200 TaxID=1184607 RepID=K6UNF5_9MICO|nr:hypothetical protein [Austwickia chelonae]GAB78936.1 hypothetical protein AUCHE_17_01500 [Austwickia chelonae NBRC 105200]SEV86880.1 hypothetical protein SAMN05421595_0151 [Austwickia chelonae]